MKKVIVTGGLGFIGSNLINQLIRRGYFVVIIDNKSYSANIQNLKGLNEKKFKVFIFDINKKNKLKKLLIKYKPYCIFNLAAETHVDRSIDAPYKFINSNVLGVLNILEVLKEYTFKLKKKTKLVHISTDEVYGDIKKNKFSKEKDRYNPSSPYAASKAAADHLISSYYRTFKLPVIITNCTNNYGPRQFPEKLIPKLITNILNNQNLPIYGNGKNEREWIHVDDHCSALIKISRMGKIGQNYNIGSGEICNNTNIAKMILKDVKKKYQKIKSKIVYVKDRPGHDLRYALNSSKLKKELKWKKDYNLRTGLKMTIDWYINNKWWIKNLNKKNYKSRFGILNDK